MTITKLPSGSYRIESMVKGKRYRFTVDHKPSVKEATILLAEKMQRPEVAPMGKTTFSAAYNKYIDVKCNVLSPATIRGYASCFRNIPDYFKNMSVYDISNTDVQKLINDYSVGRTPKTVRNLHGLINSVLKMARPDIILNTTLPAKIKTDIYTPSDEDVDKILDYVAGSKYEIPIRLATYGLRRGEICALTINDLEDNTIIIDKDIVQNERYEWIVKPTPKTEESNRKLTLDSYTVDLIKQQGYIYQGHPELITRKLNEAQDKLGIPRFSIHKLRHYFASTTHEMGISDADIMAMGGWKTDHIMKMVYREAQEKSVSKGMQMFADRMKKTSDFV